MKYRSDGSSWIVRLEKDESLTTCLLEMIKSEGIASAWISGIGGASSIELGFYDLPKKQYIWQQFNELMEITALQGNVALDPDGKPVLHLHGSFGRKDMSVIGGHIKDLIVGGTCEILVHPWSGEGLHRLPNPEIGLNLLDI